MKFFTAAVLLSLTSLASAEEFRVAVGQDKDGKNALVFNPEQVAAKVGDTIHFTFLNKNHTVTQSSFAAPCTRLLNDTTSEVGVDSGFMPVAAGAKEVPVWSIEVKQDTKPIWMFCKQGNHCNQGMVFAINAPQDGPKSFSTWKENAKTADIPKDNTPAPPSASAPPAGSSAPASGDPAAPTGSNSASAPSQASDGAAAPSSSASALASSGSAPASSGSAQSTSSALTVVPTADQANANVSPSSSTSGAFSAIRVPRAGIALTFAGFLAGMLL